MCSLFVKYWYTHYSTQSTSRQPNIGTHIIPHNPPVDSRTQAGAILDEEGETACAV